MSQKDHVIGYMGKRIGQLTRRCEALARMVNESLDAQRKAQAELRTLREQDAELRRQAAGHAELQQRYDNALGREQQKVARIAELQHDLRQRDDDNGQLREQLTTRMRPAWPGIGTAALAQDTTIEVGVSYVSPHLVGEWRCTGKDGSGTFFLTRQGAPDGRGAPQIRTVPIAGAGDAPLYLTEAPF